MIKFREDDETAFSERGRPCLIRVIDAISDLVSNDLSRRNCAALTLGDFFTFRMYCMN